MCTNKHMCAKVLNVTEFVTDVYVRSQQVVFIGIICNQLQNNFTLKNKHVALPVWKL